MAHSKHASQSSTKLFYPYCSDVYKSIPLLCDNSVFKKGYFKKFLSVGMEVFSLRIGLNVQKSFSYVNFTKKLFSHTFKYILLLQNKNGSFKLTRKIPNIIEQVPSNIYNQTKPAMFMANPSYICENVSLVGSHSGFALS